MKIILILTLCMVSNLLQATATVKEKWNWSYKYDWSTYDNELKVHYQYLPMTDLANQSVNKLDRRYNYECMVNERNLRNYFKTGSLVIAFYKIKDCKKTGKNKNWKK